MQEVWLDGEVPEWWYAHGTRVISVALRSEMMGKESNASGVSHSCL